MHKLFNGYLIVLATVWTIISSALAIQQVTQSWKYAALAFATTIMIALIATSASIFRYINNIRSGYGIFQTRSIITIRKSIIDIDKNFVPKIDIRRDIIFFSEPKPEELIDLIDTLDGNEIDIGTYSSPDSKIAQIVKVKKNRVAIQWRPKNRIVPLIPYRHKTLNSSPSLYGPDYLYHSIYVDREIGRINLEIIAPRRFEKVYAFAMPKFRRQVSENLIVKAMNYKRAGCIQPVLGSSERSMLWDCERPKLGRVYVIVGIYENEMHNMLERIRSGGLLRRAMSVVRNISM